MAGNELRYTNEAKKAGWRLEIRYDKSFVSALTMVLPASQISYREGQRSNVIKTQGGATVLDFGEDNKIITISGFVMRNYIFQINKADTKRKIGLDKEKMTGLEVFKYFKDRIMRYKTLSAEKTNLYNEQNKDLSKFEVKFYDYWNDEYWIVNIDNFEWSEQSGTPFWINYSINMTTLEKFPKKEKAPSKTVATKNALQKAKEAVSDVKKQVYAAKRQLQKTIRNIKKVIADVEDLILSVDAIITAVTESGVMVLDTVTSVIRTIDGILNVFISLPFRVATSFMRATRRLKNAMRSLENTFTKKNAYVKSFNAQKGIGSSLDGGARDDININQSDAESTIEGLLNNGGGSYVVKKGLSLQKIANEVFGDASLYPLIMVENNINVTNVQIGEIVYIPSNDVRARDLYLTDIQFDYTGMKTLSTGDLKSVTGVENVVESIQRRLLILQGEYYRNTDLGVENVIGNPSSEFLRQVVRVNMLEAILQDPRVASATEFEFTEENSAYKFQCKVTLIGGEKLVVNG